MKTAIEAPEWKALLPWPGPDAHKHARGRLGVVTGPATRTGAARLAARAGLRVGAGVVTLLCPTDAAQVLAPAVEAVMMAPFGDPAALFEAAKGMNAAVIGPAAGLDQATIDNLHALARTTATLIVDADGLSVFEGRSELLFDLLSPRDVLTPHEGEFRRLLPGLLDLGREAGALEAARLAGCVVVLKGRETVIAGPDGRIRINANGTPWLATAGTGDVLAGIIGGLIAQGMDSVEAATAGVWIHAEAARAFGPGLIAEDLPDLLPAVLASLYPG